MPSLDRLFVREVNVALLGLVAVGVVACDVHYVSLLREVRLARQELCAAKLEAVTARHPYLQPTGDLRDKCAALSALTGEPVADSRPRRTRFSL